MPIKTRNMSYLERINILKYHRYKYSDKAINIEIKLSRIYPILIFYNHEGNLINKLIRMNNHILIWKFFIFFFFFSLCKSYIRIFKSDFYLEMFYDSGCKAPVYSWNFHILNILNHLTLLFTQGKKSYLFP